MQAATAAAQTADFFEPSSERFAAHTVGTFAYKNTFGDGCLARRGQRGGFVSVSHRAQAEVV